MTPKTTPASAPPQADEPSAAAASEQVALPLAARGAEAVMPKVSLGIRHKLIGLMVAVVFLIVGAIASYFPARQIGELRSGLRDRAAVYAKLGSQQLRSSIAFSDKETAREVLGALTKDALVDGMALYTQEGKLLHRAGNLSDMAQAAGRGFAEPKVFYFPGRVLATAPVVSLEGPRGTFVLELSTREATAARNRLVQAALIVGLLGLGLGSVAAWLIARSLAQRVERIADAATKVAHGDLNNSLDDVGSTDEIGVLSRCFNAMVAQLRDLIAHIQLSAREESVRLESLVQERTHELDRRNKDMRLVLDNVEQGFVTVDRAGCVTGEFSRIIETWFGPLQAGSSLWSYLDHASPGAGENIEVAWSEVTEGTLPLVVTLDQMPTSLQAGERFIRLEYKPLGAKDFQKLLVVISDVTAKVQRERSEQEGRDLLAVTSKLLDDRTAFVQFLAETRALLGCIRPDQADLPILKRDLHTLKGNVGSYGMGGLAATCHELENRLEASGALTAIECERLVSQWERINGKLALLLGERARQQIEIDEGHHRTLLNAIRGHAPRAELSRMVECLALESLEARLGRFAQQFTATAARLEKGEARVVVTAPHLYSARDELAPFWGVFTHVVRNAAAHGLETPAQRARAGKPPVARIDLRAGVENDRFFVEVQDDGPGIDWARVRQLAKERGLPCKTEADLESALMTDGLSTQNEVNDIAGRGVGLGAVRGACEMLRGSIEIRSELGRGSLFRFSWHQSDLKSLTLQDWSTAA